MRRHQSARYFGYEQMDQRLRHGLVGHWIGGGSGLTLFDRSGRNNHGTLTAGPLWSLGREHVGQALWFDGVDDYVTAGTPASLDILGPITVAAWIRPFKLTWPDIYDIASKGYDGTNTQYMFEIRAVDGVVRWRTEPGTGTVDWTYTSPFDANVWSHIAGVFDGSNWRIYHNGIEKAVTVSSTAPGHSAEPFTIGALSSNAVPIRYFPGHIDDVRVYNRGLSPAEMFLLANQSAFYSILPVGRRAVVAAGGATPINVPASDSFIPVEAFVGRKNYRAVISENLEVG